MVTGQVGGAESGGKQGGKVNRSQMITELYQP
jgi:hypothetical protein